MKTFGRTLFALATASFLVSATMGPASIPSAFAHSEGATKPVASMPVPVPLAPAVEGAVEQAAPVEATGSCAAGMVLVQGDYCTEVRQPCLKWMEDPAQTPFARCAEFGPSECVGERVPMRFCIDKQEAADSEGLAMGDVSWTEASAYCATEGKRLCQEHEWVLACEGEAMLAYPTGPERPSDKCNLDHTDLVNAKGNLVDERQPASANPECASPYGALNMVGNVDEWVVLDKPHYSQANGGRMMKSGLKGGWWAPVRNRCRPTTVDHDEHFHQLQTGYRCCASAN